MFTIPAIPVDGQEYVFPVPDGLTAEQAVFSNLMGVAVVAMLDSPVPIGEVVAISGLGVVGQFLGRAVPSDGRQARVDRPDACAARAAKRVGADAVVAPEDATEAIMALSGGAGADMHFEVSGAPPALQASLATTTEEGRVTVVSNYGLRQANLMLSPDFHFRRLHIVSSQAVGAPPRLAPR